MWGWQLDFEAVISEEKTHTHTLYKHGWLSY